MNQSKFTYYEFFAGGGMARLGLGEQWHCLFANDFSPQKVKSYRENFPPADELIEANVFDLTVKDLPGAANMAWASFPCQDLSLAGQGHGLHGARSGSFWGYWELITSLAADNRKVPLLVLENVVGTVTVREGKDFHLLLQTLVSAGYKVGAVMIDGSLFVPQSRPRLFIIAVANEVELPTSVVNTHADPIWHTSAIYKAVASATDEVKKNWVWWSMPYPAPTRLNLVDILEDEPSGVTWHTTQETQRLLDLMNSLHRRKVNEVQGKQKKAVGAIYRRIRVENGKKVQRAEVRFDGISGCLRTGSGGSSKQFLMIIENNFVRSRLLSPREAARLMGVDDTYILPEKYSEAYHLMGDGLVVPAVAWLSGHLLLPILTPGWVESEAYRTNIRMFQPRLLEKRTSFKMRRVYE